MGLGWLTIGRLQGTVLVARDMSTGGWLYGCCYWSVIRMSYWDLGAAGYEVLQLGATGISSILSANHTANGAGPYIGIS